MSAIATHRLLNTYDQLKAAVADGVVSREQAVGVSYYANASHRDLNPSCWHVFSPFFKTAPDAHWSDYGRKAFSSHEHRPGYQEEYDGRRASRIGRQRALEAAQAWASEQYGITEWKRNRMGDYVPAEVGRRYPLPKRDQ